MALKGRSIEVKWDLKGALLIKKGNLIKGELNRESWTSKALIFMILSCPFKPFELAGIRHKGLYFCKNWCPRPDLNWHSFKKTAGF